MASCGAQAYIDSRGRYWELILPELNKAREQFSEKLDVRIDWDV